MLTINNFQDLINNCNLYYLNNKNELYNYTIIKNRKNIIKYVKNFHKKAGTYSYEIKKEICNIKSENSIIILSAHQPNLFPYSGVMIKFVLLYALKKELEKKLKINVISLFGIADHDFTNDKWVSNSFLPAINRRNGILNLSIKLPDNIVLKYVQKPSIDIINNWKKEIKKWLLSSIVQIDKYFKVQNININFWDSLKYLFKDNLKNFWNIVNKSYECSNNYSEFNAFIMSNIVNNIWKYNILFFNFTDVQEIFIEEYNYLLSNFNKYSRHLENIIKSLPINNTISGVSKKEPEYLPFWYHCNCGSKSRLTPIMKNDKLFAIGNCINCHKCYEINLGDAFNPRINNIVTNISPRAISFILLFSKGLGLSCYIGGISGVEYLKEAEYIAKKLEILFPPIVYWRPNDLYLNLSKIHMLIEYNKITCKYDVNNYNKEINKLNIKINSLDKKVIEIENKRNELVKKLREKEVDKIYFNKKLKKLLDEKTDILKNNKYYVLKQNIRVLNNINVVQNLMPSIIDYAINIGLKKTSEQWFNFLFNDGSFNKNIYLDSFLYNYLNNELIFFRNKII